MLMTASHHRVSSHCSSKVQRAHPNSSRGLTSNDSGMPGTCLTLEPGPQPVLRRRVSKTMPHPRFLSRDTLQIQTSSQNVSDNCINDLYFPGLCAPRPHPPPLSPEGHAGLAGPWPSWLRALCSLPRGMAAVHLNCVCLFVSDSGPLLS